MNKIIVTILVFFSFTKICLASDISTVTDKVVSADITKKARVRLLDKITAKSFLIDIDLNKNYRYGSLDIRIYKCWNAPLAQKPETKMLVEISETKKEDTKQIFFGWLFASSPSISSLEHPIYDITAIKCK